MFRKLFCTKAILFGLLGMAMPLMAIDSSWDIPQSNYWSHPSAWDNHYPPRSTGDNATIALPYTVSLGGWSPVEGAPQIYPDINSINITDTAAALNINYAIPLGLNGDSVNNGMINVDSLNHTSYNYLNINSSLTMSGSGMIKLEKNYYARLNTLNGSILTQDTDHTIAGTGQLNANLVNNGTVNANISGQPLNIVTMNKVNNSLFTATNGGILNIGDSRTIDQTGGGRIVADSGTVRIHSGAVILGGELDSNPGGNLEIGATTGLVSVTNLGILNMPSGSTVNVTGSGFTNNGTVNVDSNNATGYTTFNFAETGSFMGSGDLKLIKDTYSILKSTDGVTITNGPDHTIHGTGELESQLVNEGLVSADVNASELSLTNKDKTNNNKVTASNGGVLVVGAITVTQDDEAVIEADGGTVKLNSNGTIVGGKVNTANDGELYVSNINMQNVTNTGKIDTYGGAYLDITGGAITNNGEIIINSQGYTSYTYLRFLEDGMLTGNGETKLVKSTYSKIVSSNSDITVTNDVNHTIHGAGELEAKLVNDNMIVADVASSSLNFSVNDKVNNGTIRATNDGIATLGNITINQGENGLIEADGGKVSLHSTTIVDGTVNSKNNGEFLVYDLANMQNVTNTGMLEVGNGARLNITGGDITNNANISLNKYGYTSYTYLNFPEDGKLTGTGSVDLGKRDYCRVIAPEGVAVTNDTQHTIRGNGELFAKMVNDGLISADSDRIRLSTYDKVNNSEMEAVNGATLYIDGIDVDQSLGGIINASGGTVKLSNGATISEGTISSSGDGNFRIEGTGNFNNLTNEALVDVRPGARLYFKGGEIVNNNLIQSNVDRYTSYTYYEFPENALLSGTGDIVMGRDYYCRMISDPEIEVTNSSTHTIRGEGVVESYLVNDGMVISDREGKEIRLETNSKVNNNTIKTVNGSVVKVNGITVSQDPGAVLEADNGTFKLNQAVIDGGNIVTENGGKFVVESVSTLNGVTSTADVVLNHGQRLKVGPEGLINNGSIVINPYGYTSYTYFDIDQTATISGTGSVEMGRDYYTHIVVAEGAVLTNSADHTIGGKGMIDGSVVNDGTLRATGEVRLNGQFDFEPGSTYETEIGAGGAGYVNVYGQLVYNGGTVKATFKSDIVVSRGQVWNIAKYDTSSSGIVINAEPLLDAPQLANNNKLELIVDDTDYIYLMVVEDPFAPAVNDCNGNGISDADDIEMGISTDYNNNGIPDECDIPGDIDGDMDVDIADLSLALNLWLMQGCEPCMQLDADGNGIINLVEFSVMADYWLLGTE